MGNVLELYLDDEKSPYTLIVEDFSTYKKASVKDPYLRITAPGFNPTVVEFDPNSRNVYSSANIGICVGEGISALPDGIYTFEYKVYPYSENDITQYHLRTYTIESNLNEIIREGGDGLDLYKAKALIDAAKAAARVCDVESAVSMYQTACKVLNRYKKCNCSYVKG